MAKRLEEIFEECLERMERGESIESCLASYPEESGELEFMLRAFVNVKWRSSLVEPSPQFKAWGKAQLYNAFNAERARQAATEPKRHGMFGLHRIWVPALAGLMIFILLGGVGTAAASSSAMPDQPLYSVKLATEQVRLALSFSDVDKAEVNTKIAETRAQEIAAMAELGKTEYVLATTERMLDSLESAEQAINRVFGEAPDVPPEPQFKPQPGQQPEPQLQPQPGQQPEPQLQPQPVQQPEPQPGEKPEQPSVTKPETPSVQQPKPEPSSSANVTSTGKDNLRNQDTVQQVQSERVTRSFEDTLNKNVTVLEDALNKAPESTKSVIQNALDITRTKKRWIESQNKSRWWDRNQKDILQENNQQSGDKPAGTTDGSGKSTTDDTRKDTAQNNTPVTGNTTTNQINTSGTKNVSDSRFRQDTTLNSNTDSKSINFRQEISSTVNLPSKNILTTVADNTDTTGVR